MKTLKLDGVWEASRNSDSTEGRGYKIHIGYFTRESDAQKAVIGQGVMGTDGDVRQVEDETIRVYETYAEFQKANGDRTRDRALAKLTAEEKRALGL